MDATEPQGGELGDARDLTSLIVAARQGGDAQRQELLELLYVEIKQISAGTPYVGRRGDTLQPTAVASEIFVELCRRFPPPPLSLPESRATFFQSVAFATRRIVREHWRAKQALKRGGGRAPAPLLEEPDPPASSADPIDALALDEALDHLESYNERWFGVVMHRYYAGRTIEETAALLGCATSTVTTDWRLARAWLARRLGE
ncbi:MAG: hypothetical protein IT431_10635 [Phycisphaerales bacterium]|nr:hypothetical protein [Phycisphaerales bacterium]